MAGLRRFASMLLLSNDENSSGFRGDDPQALLWVANRVWD